MAVGGGHSMYLRSRYMTIELPGWCWLGLLASALAAATFGGQAEAGRRQHHRDPDKQFHKPPPPPPPAKAQAKPQPPPTTAAPKPPTPSPNKTHGTHAKQGSSPKPVIAERPKGGQPTASQVTKPPQATKPPQTATQAVPAPKPKPAVALPAPPVLPPPPPPTAAPTPTPAPTQAKAPEPVTPTPSGGANEDQLMKVGVLQRENEPGAQPLVKSAADKANPQPDAGSPAPVISLGVGLPPQTGTYRKNEIIAGKLTPAARARAIQLGYDVREGSSSGLTRILLPPQREAWEILRGLEEEFPNQGFALNHLYEPYRNVLGNAPVEAMVPVSPSVGCSTERCYGRRVIEWKDHLAACARGVKVGVIDTGFDAAHPAFTKRAVPPTVVMSPESTTDRAKTWHGTGVLSLLAGASRSSTPGLIPDADFLVADAFFADPEGRPQTDTMHLLEALERLHERGAQIINMSLVGPYDELIHGRIAYLSKRKGVVFVAAAGNGGPSAPPGYPAAYPEVIAVTAVDSNAKGYSSANRGSYINVAAPGVRIWTALPDNHEGMLSGTSFAAPFVTAIAAVTYNNSLLKSQIAARRHSLDPKETTLAGFFIDKVEGGDSKVYGRGLIKAPPDCAPKDQAPQPWAAKVLPRLVEPLGWLTDVRPAAFR